MRFARVVSAFDCQDPSIDRLVETTDLDVLQLDYAWPMKRDPRYQADHGYATGLLEQFQRLHKTLYLDPRLHLISNAGGTESTGFVERLAARLDDLGDGELPITAIRGDNVLPQLEELAAAGIDLREVSTQQPLHEFEEPIVAAQVELGGGPIATALDEGSRIVIAGCYDGSAPAIGAAVSAKLVNWDQAAELAEIAVATALPDTVNTFNRSDELQVRTAIGDESVDPQHLQQSPLAFADDEARLQNADVQCCIRDLRLQSTESLTYRLSGITDANLATQWQLRLTCRLGFFAEAMFECRADVGPSLGQQIRRAFEGITNARCSLQIDLLRNAEYEAAAWIYVCCRSLDQEPCEVIARDLRNMAVRCEYRDCHLVGSSPAALHQYIFKYCNLPRDAVTVSVDTRPANEWR